MFWWTIVPVLVLVTFPAVLSSVRAKLDSTPAPEGTSATLSHVNNLLRLDIILLILMVFVAAGIHYLGEYCNTHRDRLLALFRPALVMAIVSTILILIIQSALLSLTLLCSS